MSEEPTRYELFFADFKKNPDEFRTRLKGAGTFEFCDQVKQLEKLSSKLNGDMMTYLFGDTLGRHMAEKFAGQCGRNLLFFLNLLTVEYRMFILYELKTNKTLLMYG